MSGLIKSLSQLPLLKIKLDSVILINGQLWQIQVLLNFQKGKIESFGNSFQTWKKNVFNLNKMKLRRKMLTHLIWKKSTLSKLTKLDFSKSKELMFSMLVMQILITENTKSSGERPKVPSSQDQNQRMEIMFSHTISRSRSYSKDTCSKLPMTIQLGTQRAGILLTPLGLQFIL